MHLQLVIGMRAGDSVPPTHDRTAGNEKLLAAFAEHASCAHRSYPRVVSH